MRKYFGILLILWAIAGCLSTPRGTGSGNAPTLAPSGEGGEGPGSGPADERLSDTPPVAFPGEDESPRSVKPPVGVYCEGENASVLDFERATICDYESKPEWSGAAVTSPIVLGEPGEILTVMLGFHTDMALAEEESVLLPISPADLSDGKGHQIQADEEGKARFQVSVGRFTGRVQLIVIGSKANSCGEIRVGVCPVDFDSARMVPMKNETKIVPSKPRKMRFIPSGPRRGDGF